MKEIEKSQWIKAQDALDKALEKDSIDVESHHVYSILLSDGRAPQFNIDKASYHNHKASRLYESLEEKEKNKLTKSGLDETVLQSQELFIDSIAFLVALQINTERGYKHFIDSYPGASQISRAIESRNSLAFEAARSENTIAAYRDFLDKYPKADESERAKQELDKLLYEQQAKGAGLQEMISFIKAYPDNPYRKEVEFNVFKEMTGSFSTQSLNSYIQLLPASSYSQLAVDFLFHLNKEDSQTTNFFNNIQGYKKADSLKEVIKAEKGFLIPLIKDDKLGFINNSGETILNPSIESPEESLLCTLITSDLLKIDEADSTRVINRLQTQILKADIDSIKDLGNGFVRIAKEGKKGLVHKNGFIFFNPSYRDIELVHGSIFKFRKAESWGLMNPFEKVILQDNLSSINNFGEIVLLEKNGRVGLYKIEDLLQFKGALSFKYDEVEILPNGEFLCFLDDKEELLSPDLKILIPLGENEINSFNDKWISLGETFSTVYNGDGTILLDSLQKFLPGKDLLGYKRKGKWYIRGSNNEMSEPYDSLKLLGNDIFQIFSNSKVYARFPGNKNLDLSQSGTVTFLRPNLDITEDSFILTFDKDGTKRLYDSNGKKVLAGWFDEVIPLNNFIFHIKEKGKSGLSDSTGRNVLPIEYDGVGAYARGIVPTLKKGKFGVFSYPEKNIIEADYDILPKPYNDSLIIASMNKKFGIISHKEMQVLPFIYDEIEFWSETHALTKLGSKRYLRSLYSKDSIAIGNLDKIMLNNGSEFFIYSTRDGAGVVGPGKKEIVKPLFTDINYLTNENEIVFTCGKYFSETDLYIVAYFSEDGNLIWRNSVSREDYQQFLCKDPSSASR